MKYRLLILFAALSVLAFVVDLQAQTRPTAAPAKAWAVPKTPWGDPDIQGTWTSDDCIGTPM